MFSLVWLMLLSYSTLVQGKSIFILAGQSNMSGRGGVVNETWDGFIPPECQSNPLILRLNAALTWEEAQEPLHHDIDVTKTCGIGPGMAFSNSILERDLGIGAIGLVPCAIGGTNISEWRRGGRLYNQVLSRAQAALHGGGALIRAILWYQGESDTIKLEDAKLYKRRLEKFFTEIRSDLFSPVLPIIQVALASGEGHYVNVIRKSQMEIDLPNVRCVNAMGLQLQPDGLHLSTAAQVELGRMMADAFLQIMAPLSVRSTAPKRFNNFFLDFFLRWFRKKTPQTCNFFLLWRRAWLGEVHQPAQPFYLQLQIILGSFSGQKGGEEKEIEAGSSTFIGAEEKENEIGSNTLAGGNTQATVVVPGNRNVEGDEGLQFDFEDEEQGEHANANVDANDVYNI